MGRRLLWRRLTTAAGIYSSSLLGFAGTIVAARLLGPREFGSLAIVVAAAGFFQILLDLTAEESLVKFGFRYSEGRDWARLRRLFSLALGLKLAGGALAGLALLALAPFADRVFGADDLAASMRIAAALPLAQAPEGVAASALILRSRYDVRGALLAVSMGLRLAALAVAGRYGVRETVIGLLCAQMASTAAIGLAGWLAFRRFPSSEPASLAAERREILRFVLQSSIGTGVVSLQRWLAPLLLGIVAGPLQVAYFRAAQAPQAGFASLSSPVRLILLTEQTRDWERGRHAVVLSGVRRYMAVSALLMAVALPPLLWFMPDLVRLAFTSSYDHASDGARLILVAAALGLVYGWTKSLPVSIGRPKLRIVAHGIEALVLAPSLLVFGELWGATGGAGALLLATVAFVVVWTVLLLRLQRAPVGGGEPGGMPAEAH
jgi:O-antigen/teichoic acid export membrane protein